LATLSCVRAQCVAGGGGEVGALLERETKGAVDWGETGVGRKCEVNRVKSVADRKEKNITLGAYSAAPWEVVFYRTVLSPRSSTRPTCCPCRSASAESLWTWAGTRSVSRSRAGSARLRSVFPLPQSARIGNAASGSESASAPERPPGGLEP
jgi:hypothetical protein